MAQQIGRILVDAVGPGALQFFLSVASRQETDAKRPGPAGGQHIPDAVTDDDAPIDRYAEPLGSGQEHVGVRLGMTDLVRSEERRVGKECRSRWSPYH